MSEEATAEVEEGVIEESPVSTENRPLNEEKEPEKVVEQEEEPKAADEVERKQPKHATAQDRIRYLDRENKNKQAILNEKEKRIQELEAAQQKKTVEDIKRPRSEDFETDEEYNNAIDEYYDSRLDVRLKEKEAARVADEQQKAKATQWDGFFNRIDSLPEEQRAKAIEAASNEEISYSAVMQNVVQESDHGPELVSHFHDNPEVAESISRMGLLQAVNEMNKITGNLIKSKTAKTVSAAPTPVKPVSGGDAPIDKDPDEMSPEEWMAWRNKNSKVH